MHPTTLVVGCLGALVVALVARQIGHHVRTGGKLFFQTSGEGGTGAVAGGCWLQPNGTRLCPEPVAAAAQTDGGFPDPTDPAPPSGREPSGSHSATLPVPPAPASAAETFTAAQLQDAAHRGDAARVKRILDAAAGLVNVADGNGWTALHQAARAGAAEVARLLLAAGADVGLRTTTGRTAADVARERLAPNHAVRALLLRAAGEPVVHVQGIDGSGGSFATPTDLRDASDRGQVDRIRSYLAALSGASDVKRHAFLNHGDTNGWTALHLAARAGHAAVTRLLLKGGADLAARTGGKPRTALTIALERHDSDHEVVAVLREASVEEEL